MTQFLRDQASDSEEVVTPLMLDGTYLSRNCYALKKCYRRHQEVTTAQPPVAVFMDVMLFPAGVEHKRNKEMIDFLDSQSHSLGINQRLVSRTQAPLNQTINAWSG